MGSDPERNLEFDLQALSARLRADEAFAVEMYCALCNSDWRHDDGTEWSGSWRYSAGLVATLRGRGENYLDFYCSGIPGHAEGTISDRVAEAMAELGWTGTAYGSDHVYATDFQAGETKVWIDGDWVPVEESDVPGAGRFREGGPHGA